MEGKEKGCWNVSIPSGCIYPHERILASGPQMTSTTVESAAERVKVTCATRIRLHKQFDASSDDSATHAQGKRPYLVTDISEHFVQELHNELAIGSGHSHLQQQSA